ncbi:unnamed protein product [Microthlaspi erraticum]|uniref:Uncharacterized protein n=1 Tax=Microthlaspi erraticum TaxID=1685480 RepID=A0A6D2JZZ6_9BRAS|nr:unnamed protein product [Microthlaspi erraticum]
MSPTTIALFLVSFVITGTSSDVAPAAKEFHFFLSSHEHEQPQFLTVEGCNNECKTACCNCDIEQQPPVCVQCCRI